MSEAYSGPGLAAGDPDTLRPGEEEMRQARGTELGGADDPFVPAGPWDLPVVDTGHGRDARYGRLGGRAHPPLDCPAPTRTATLRGFYHCPGCGVKVPLAGTVPASEWGHEAGERWAEVVIGGLVQAWWLTWDLAVASWRGVAWLWARRWSGRRAAGAGGREVSEAAALMRHSFGTAIVGEHVTDEATNDPPALFLSPPRAYRGNRSKPLGGRSQRISAQRAQRGSPRSVRRVA